MPERQSCRGLAGLIGERHVLLGRGIPDVDRFDVRRIELEHHPRIERREQRLATPPARRRTSQIVHQLSRDQGIVESHVFMLDAGGRQDAIALYSEHLFQKSNVSDEWTLVLCLRLLPGKRGRNSECAVGVVVVDVIDGHVHQLGQLLQMDRGDLGWIDAELAHDLGFVRQSAPKLVQDELLDREKHAFNDGLVLRPCDGSPANVDFRVLAGGLVRLLALRQLVVDDDHAGFAEAIRATQDVGPSAIDVALLDVDALQAGHSRKKAGRLERDDDRENHSGVEVDGDG
jgi:hypothetical protein